VLQTDPGSPAALFLLAQTLISLKKNDLATRALVVAVERAVDASMMPLAIASAAMLESLGTNASTAFDAIASAFSKSSPRFGAAAPPPLHPAVLNPLADAVAGAELFKAATVAIDAAKALPRKSATLVRQPFFSALGKAGLRSLIATLEIKSFARGEKIIEQGSTGAEAFVIVRGEVDVVREPHEERGGSINLARLSKGALFGEMALLSRAPRAAAVIAAKPVVVLVARRDELERVAEVEPEIANELAAHTRTRMLQNLVRTSAILGAIDASERPALIERFQAVSFEPGEYLVRQNQISSGLHLIASGQVSVMRTDGAEQLEIASLNVGDVVGEVSLILRRPSTADVVAIVPTVSMVLPREAFHDIIKTHPNLLAQLYDLAVKRDEETSSIVAQEGVHADDLVLVLAWRSNHSACSNSRSRREGKRSVLVPRSPLRSRPEICCSSREISVPERPF
jgi:cAMP-dependent protein kinase regulator